MALTTLWKVLYGAAFLLLVPAALAAWAATTAHLVHIQPAASLPLGVLIAVSGSLLMVAGMAALWIQGGGLPMNAYPPPRFVARGVYGMMPHPIYTGFTAVCVGISIAAGSASGLYLVSPLVAVGCAALVLGYERHDLEQRFGDPPARLLPRSGDGGPTASDRLRCHGFVLLPWVVLYEAVVRLGAPTDAVSGLLAFERLWPVLEWSEAIYASAYVVTALAPLVARTRRDLRTFAVRGLGTMAVGFPLYLVIPLIAPPRPFVAQTALGRLLAWERALDGPEAAFPSFHVIWAVLAAEVFTKRWPALRWTWRGWAVLVAASCVTTGQHGIVDVLGGFATVALVWRADLLWRAIRSLAERIANSWRE
jgi:protein-S-isoprenylcysteine O-methyltransferase Ste14/membrane-associated phospholipid phosphatase